MKLKIERKDSLLEYSLYIACFLSIISQMPFFVQAGMTQVLAFPGWILLALVIVLKKRIAIKKSTITMYLFAAVVVVWLIIDSLLVGKNIFSSSMVYSYMISLFLFTLGACATGYFDGRILKNMNLVYAAATLLVTVSIFFQYFGFGYRLSSKVYAYSSKNSVSQIILTGIILLILGFDFHKSLARIVRAAVVVFEIYVILLLRSRATLVGLLLALVIIVISRLASKKIKYTVTLAGIVMIVLLILNDSFYRFIINNVLFAGRNASDLNELTSGRVNILLSFPKLISGRWFTGIGPLYYECFPLSAILQFGIFGGLIMILITLQPLIKSFIKMKHSNNWSILFIISLVYVVNGLFEGLTPFGPGVKCYYLWLLYGILLGHNSSSEQNGYVSYVNHTGTSI